MKLTFEQTIDDIKDLNKNFFLSNKWIKGFAIFYLVLIAINFITEIILHGFQFQKMMSWIIPLVMIIGIWILIMKFAMKRIANNPSSKKLLLGERTIELLEENIRIKTASSNSTMDWSTIQKMSQSKKSYFLHLGGIQAIIVSKRAFENEGDMKLFENLVSAKIS